MAKQVALSDEQLALGDIDAHHRDLESSLTLYFSEGSPAYAARFAGYASQEVHDELGERLDEAGLSSSLTVLAAVEAAFRIDYLRRCYERKKDPVSLALRAIYRRKQQKTSLEDEIFEAWINNSSGVRLIVGELRGAFRFRHWLAHGRYWEPKFGRRCDFDYLFVLADQTFRGFPFYDGS
jgi:hypothetical protein